MMFLVKEKLMYFSFKILGVKILRNDHRMKKVLLLLLLLLFS